MHGTLQPFVRHPPHALPSCGDGRRKERGQLYEHLDNKFSRMSPFPPELRKALAANRDALGGRRKQAAQVVYGSPALDFELNYGWSLGNVLEALEHELKIRNRKVGHSASQQISLQGHSWQPTEVVTRYLCPAGRAEAEADPEGPRQQAGGGCDWKRRWRRLPRPQQARRGEHQEEEPT
jgi:hypothetical protein